MIDMKNEKNIRDRQANFRQTNAYAMQHGMALGIWAIVCQACYVLGLTSPLFSNLWMMMLLGIPIVTCLLTLRLRKIVGNDVTFPFSRGFVHAILTVMYASVWAAVATFVYMQFFDKGHIFDYFTEALSRPEMQKMLKESGLESNIKNSTDGMTVVELIDALRSFGAANYAAMIVYFYMLSSPFIAVLSGLVSMRRVRYANVRGRDGHFPNMNH